MLAVSGYFVGLRQTTSSLSMTRPVEVVKPETQRDLTGATNVPVAVRYIDQDWTAHGANTGWKSSFAGLASPPPPPSLPAGSTARIATTDERKAALKTRASLRAFDGAPPVVPHPITQDSSVACLVCHGNGLQVKDRFASKMSHATFGGSCTQCHVSSSAPMTIANAGNLNAPLTENTFIGRDAPISGTRAWPGAPPTIPHRTLMRSDCMSCHGPSSLFALRTPHPDRQSCTQCHVPSAQEDQRVFASVPALGTVPLPADLLHPPAPKSPSPPATTEPAPPAATPAPPQP